MHRYFSSKRIGETLFPSFKGVLATPNEYFVGMPDSDEYRDSMWLLSIYLAIPALMTGLATGVLSILIILPLSLVLGLPATWMWAAYLSWAARRFCDSQLTTADAFRICAYSSAPLVFSWIPILGLVAWLWNLYLNWQGLISHAKLGAGASLLIIFAAFFIMALSFAILIALLFYASAHYGVQIPAVTWI